MKKYIYLLLLACLCSACASNNLVVSTAADGKVSLNYNRTYSILKDYNFQKLDADSQDIIINEIERQMSARGYKVQEEGGDLSVLFSVYAGSMQFRYSEETQPRLKKGTLLIHLVDETLNRSVWMGYASGLFEKQTTIPERELRVATRRIMDEYPAFAYGFAVAARR